MLQAILRRYRLRPTNVLAKSTQQTTEEKAIMDITVRNTLTGKLTNFFKVESQLATILCASGLAQPYTKPQPAPAPTTFRVEASTHTGAMGLHYIKPNGEQHSTFNAAVSKEKLQAGWGVEIPAQIWQTFLAKSKATAPAQQ